MSKGRNLHGEKKKNWVERDKGYWKTGTKFPDKSPRGGGGLFLRSHVVAGTQKTLMAGYSKSTRAGKP